MYGYPPPPPPPPPPGEGYPQPPPTPEGYPKGYNTYGGNPPPPPPNGGTSGCDHSSSNDNTMNREMTAPASSDSMQPNFITPNFSGTLQYMLPSAGTVRPSDGGVVQSSKFMSSSETKKDGVQHKQSLNYKMVGESGKYSDSKEWFDKTRGQSRKRDSDDAGSDSEGG